MRRPVAPILLLSSTLLLTSCAARTYNNFVFPSQEESTLVPVDDISRITDYDDGAPEDQTITVISSPDGLCVMEVKEHYCDITLDLENGDHYAVGKAYGDVIMMVASEGIGDMESYLYENARYFFEDVDDSTYEELQRRTSTLFASLPQEYQDEISGLADAVTDTTGFTEDGILSYDEMILAQFIPDALRGTACSAVSLDGTRTTSGQRITSRLLEWPTGTEDQVASLHAVVHYLNGDKSFVSVGVLGVFTPFSLMSDDGVFISMLDVGSEYMDFNCEDKSSYTFGMRYAIENYDTARDAAQYMSDHAYDYTYCANIFITDEDEALCVELSVTPEDGEPIIRDEDTPLLPQIQNTAEDCLFVVNGYVCEGHADSVMNYLRNAVRWLRFDRWFTGDRVFSMGEFKEIMTSEDVDEDSTFNRIGNNDMAFHWVIADYGTRTIQASFTTIDPQGDPPVLYEVAQF